MSANDPQFLYMILVLPSLFGLTLVGEGIHKVVNDEIMPGMVSVIFGLAFIGIVIFAYLLFSSYLAHKV